MPHARRAAVAIVGTGRVARALARSLVDKGEPVVAIAGRNSRRTREAAAFLGRSVRPLRLADLPANAGRVLIAVSDTAIPEVAGLLAKAGMNRGVVLHTCGALGPEALASLASKGVSCGALHPLQTFASAEQGMSVLPGSTFAAEGDAAALRWARRIARLLGGRTLCVPPGMRPLYHAASVMASNYLIALLDAAAMLMSEAGVARRRHALAAVGPLALASVTNAVRSGPLRALTGPIQRGDLETVRTHMAALAAVPVELRELYCAAGRQTLNLAIRRGLDRERARRMQDLLEKG